MKIVRLYQPAMGALLLGLMFLDKPFAYLGVGSFFITEMVLLLGIAALFVHVHREGLDGWSGVPWLQIAALTAFLVFEGVRTAVDIPRYRQLALRDGVVWGYAFFAVIIVTVIHRETVRRWILGYRGLAPIFVTWVPIAVVLYALRPGEATVPGRSISLYLFKPGDLLVHLAGAGAALALWPRKEPKEAPRGIGRWLIVLAWGIGFVMAASLTRGGLVACLAGLAVVAVFGRWKQVAKLAAGASVALLLFAVTGIKIDCPAIGQGALDKEVSARQLVTQVSSTVNRAVSLLPVWRKLQPGVGKVVVTREKFRTVRWRLAWWKKIMGYTVGGPYALGGKGFGINLADADGFQPRKDHGLRDPHNVFMTFLARSGVPGLVLFVFPIGVALVDLFTTWRRSGGEDRRVAIWLSAYLAAMLVNACFDVYIENPMGGVWFWTMMGAAMVLSADHGRRRRGAETAA